MLSTRKAKFSHLRLFLLIFILSCAHGNFLNGGNSEVYEPISGKDQKCINEKSLCKVTFPVPRDVPQSSPMIIVAEDMFEKRNNMNKFKS